MAHLIKAGYVVFEIAIANVEVLYSKQMNKIHEPNTFWASNNCWRRNFCNVKGACLKKKLIWKMFHFCFVFWLQNSESPHQQHRRNQRFNFCFFASKVSIDTLYPIWCCFLETSDFCASFGFWNDRGKHSFRLKKSSLENSFLGQNSQVRA